MADQFPRGGGICRGCGCSELAACMTDRGPCAWVLLDLGAPTGICSACAEEWEFDQPMLAGAIIPAVAAMLGLEAPLENLIHG